MVSCISELFVCPFIQFAFVPICFSVLFQDPSSDTTGVDVGKFQVLSSRKAS